MSWDVDSMRDSRRSGYASRLFVGMAAILSSAGCDSGGLPDMVPIRGEVTYNGEPLREGTVVYLPSTPGQGRQATGGIGSDGTFVMTTHTKDDGVMMGEYNIVIFAYKPHPGEPKTREEWEAIGGRIERGYIIPEKYVSPATSGLRDSVNDDHSGFKQLELSD
jgi:hypothetical protein